MIYVSNEDQPGFIGRFASLGNARINITTFAFGRDCPGSAIARVEVNGPIPPDWVLAEIEKLPASKRPNALAF